jgi:hypothetical protein
MRYMVPWGQPVKWLMIILTPLIPPAAISKGIWKSAYPRAARATPINIKKKF